MSPLALRLLGSLALSSACGLALSGCDTGIETEAHAQPASPSPTTGSATGAAPSRSVAPGGTSPSSTPGSLGTAADLPTQAELDAEAARITSQNADAEYQRLKDELDGDS